MRTLAAIQFVFAVTFLLVGTVTLVGIGITGLIFLLPGIAFAAIAGVAAQRKRAAVLLALVADAALAFLALRHIDALRHPGIPHPQADPAALALLRPSWLDWAVPSLTLALVAAGTLAALVDWRAVRNSGWW